ncbi:MAG: ribosome biogenesis GTP-binding protein YihA/YsxC [Desulfotomaculales bacterium]
MTVPVEFFGAASAYEQCPAGQRPEVALAGRSNVGKSSLLNALAKRKKLAAVSKTPGRTRTINFYLVKNSYFLVDLPGYGYARVPGELKKSWSRLVEDYLHNRKQLRGILHLVDIRLTPGELDRQLAEWLRFSGLPAAVVATKADKISRGEGQRQLALIKEALRLPAEVPLIRFSAVTGEGKKELWQIIEKWVN